MLSQSFTAASRRRFDTSPVYGVTYLRSITSTSSAFREESAFDYRILPFQIDHCPGEQLNCGCHFAAKRSSRRLALPIGVPTAPIPSRVRGLGLEATLLSVFFVVGGAASQLWSVPLSLFTLERRFFWGFDLCQESINAHTIHFYCARPTSSQRSGDRLRNFIVPEFRSQVTNSFTEKMALL